MRRFTSRKKQIFLLLFLFLMGSGFGFAAEAQVETKSFFVENTYDIYGRKEIETTLLRTTDRLYFYVETQWWQNLSADKQNTIRIAVFELGSEFQNTIYPVLTRVFGSEPKPGIDGDERMTIVIHEMARETGGYFNSGDVYSKFQNPRSNEREMIYLNSYYIDTAEAKSFLAHEFVHLIGVEQKDLKKHVTEETWLNEARAEYAPTLLGYDTAYQGSNLQRRVHDFISKPSDALTEWLNRKEDYGVSSMFIHYLVDYYGIQILVDSLRSSQVGIASLNEALKTNGFDKNFAQIYEDWAIAVLVNNCDLGERYCYKNTNLADIRVTPTLYFLPSTETILSTYHVGSPWSAYWHRLVGGSENLSVQFKGAEYGMPRIPYVLCEHQDNCLVKFLTLDNERKGSIVLSDFEKIYNSLTLIPFIAEAAPFSSGSQNSFSWEVSVQKEAVGENGPELIQEFLMRITQLQEQVRQLQAQLAAISQNQGGAVASVSCDRFESNISFGQSGEEVKCLQEFLKSQGAAIYPEGLITGNFLSLTKQAVVRFQEKYASDILAPVNENRGTGYVGSKTRDKIKQLLGV